MVARLEELEIWPVFNEPYIVKDAFGEYTETILSGATDDAEVFPDQEAMMVVAQQEWNEDFTVRIVRRIAKYAPR